jgi:uncharacterized membrane protein
MAEEKDSHPATEQTEQQTGRSKLILLTSAEGRLLLIGVAMAFVYTGWLGIKALVSPETSQALIGITVTCAMFGRAAGMAFGYSVGLGHGTVIVVSALIETVFVLIFFPLFVFSWRRLLVFKRLKSLFDRIHKAAEARSKEVQRYGVLGLFVFVWFPFWMTGPLVGAVIGFMLGLRVWLDITVVLSGTYVAIFCWAFFLRRFYQHVASYSPYAAVVTMAVLVAVIIAGHLLHQTSHNNKHDS